MYICRTYEPVHIVAFSLLSQKYFSEFAIKLESQTVYSVLLNYQARSHFIYICKLECWDTDFQTQLEPVAKYMQFSR